MADAVAVDAAPPVASVTDWVAMATPAAAATDAAVKAAITRGLRVAATRRRQDADFSKSNAMMRRGRSR